ncbi:hypothetical protein QFZ63_005437 [Streptomyces sp. B3I7]|nr:hypothetical protein [Streptomyces sp. B3I7]
MPRTSRQTTGSTARRPRIKGTDAPAVSRSSRGNRQGAVTSPTATDSSCATATAAAARRERYRSDGGGPDEVRSLPPPEVVSLPELLMAVLYVLAGVLCLRNPLQTVAPRSR